MLKIKAMPLPACASLVCAWPAVPQSRPKCLGRQQHGRTDQPLSRRLRALAARSAGLLGRGRQGRSTGSSSRKRSSTRTPASTAAGSPAASVNTCYNALDRHVLAGRNDQAALIYDSPVTNTKQTFTYGRLLSEVQLLGAMLRDFGVEEGRRRHHLHADGAGGGVRHARLRAHRRHPFGGVRRLRGQGTRHPHRRRQAESDPVGELRHRRRARHPL